MNAMTPDERIQINQVLTPGEEVLWLGRAMSKTQGGGSTLRRGVVQRLRAWLSGSSPIEQPINFGLAHVYVLTNKRVVDMVGGALQKEWPLMLGMVQKVETQADGSGDIIFDYEIGSEAAQVVPCGLLQVEDVNTVHAKLAAAIDAAYLASPWT